MFCVVLIVLSFVLVGRCQYTQSSPCPETFWYEMQGDTLYGFISVPAQYSDVTLTANFTIKAQLPSEYVGEVEPVGSQNHLGTGNPITYRVHFPVRSPTPRLTALLVNGQGLCYGPGDIPGPGQYVTTISLSHMLYGSGNPANSFEVPDTFLRPQGGSKIQSESFFNKFNTDEEDVSIIRSRPSKRPPLNDFTITIDGEQYVFSPDRFGSGGAQTNSIRPNKKVLRPARPWKPPQLVTPVPSSPRTQTPTQTLAPQTRSQQTRAPQQTQTPKTLPPQTQAPPQTEAPQLTLRPQTQAPTTPAPRPVQRPVPTPEIPPKSPESSFECGIVSGGNDKVPLVFGGTDANRSDWPWLTAIYRRKAGTLSFACGGTLVSPQTVISAAHCIRHKSSQTSKADVVVKVGVFELEAWGDSNEEIRTVRDVHIHPSYNRITYTMDIMVLILNRAVQYSEFIRPACLWSGDISLGRVVNSFGTVIGWGKSSELGLPGQGSPKMARIPIVSTETCRASKPQFFGITSEYTLCAGDRNGTGPCNGDSGGGLYLLWNGKWTLRGVVSISLSKDLAGELLCDLNEYVVFTDSAKFIDWLRQLMT